MLAAAGTEKGHPCVHLCKFTAAVFSIENQRRIFCVLNVVMLCTIVLLHNPTSSKMAGASGGILRISIGCGFI